MSEEVTSPQPLPEGGTLRVVADRGEDCRRPGEAHLNYTSLIASQTADAEKYKYRYADLAGVLAAVQPALAKSGIAESCSRPR